MVHFVERAGQELFLLTDGRAGASVVRGVCV